MSDVHKLIAKAERTNASRDKVDLEHDFAPPPHCSSDLLLRTAMDAIVAGMKMSDWDCVAEGYVMLRQLHRGVYGKDYDAAKPIKEFNT